MNAYEALATIIVESELTKRKQTEEAVDSIFISKYHVYIWLNGVNYVILISDEVRSVLETYKCEFIDEEFQSSWLTDERVIDAIRIAEMGG